MLNNLYFPRREKRWSKFIKNLAIFASIAGVIFLMFWQLPAKVEKVQKEVENLKPVSVDSTR